MNTTSTKETTVWGQCFIVRHKKIKIHVFNIFQNYISIKVFETLKDFKFNIFSESISYIEILLFKHLTVVSLTYLIFIIKSCRT